MVCLRRTVIFGLSSLLLLLPLAACAPKNADTQRTQPTTQSQTKPLEVGAIPDQDPEKLQRLYTKLADYLEKKLGVPVEYKPVTDYAAAVTAFKVGDLDLVWFGGLTGVQARSQVPGASAIAQRDIDEKFQSVFIANAKSNISEIKDTKGLTVLKGHTFTFGSESSTSGRLMPQYFLEQGGVTLADFKGEAGFSSNHDATIKLVEAGSYEAGVVNAKVWEQRLAEGKIDQSKVKVIWRTPTYYDYHWVISPDVEKRYGQGFTEKVQAALTSLNPNVPEEKEILDLFGGEKFIPTKNENYAQIEAVGRQIGKIQ